MLAAREPPVEAKRTRSPTEALDQPDEKFWTRLEVRR
jgi:hypothetical protein